MPANTPPTVTDAPCEWEKRCRWIVDHISYRGVQKLLGPPYDKEPLPIMTQDELIAVIDRCRATIGLIGDEWEGPK